jgi:hypothetical protein
MEDKAKDTVIHYYTKIVITKLIVKYFSQEKIKYEYFNGSLPKRKNSLNNLLRNKFFSHYF